MSYILISCLVIPLLFACLGILFWGRYNAQLVVLVSGSAALLVSGFYLLYLTSEGALLTHHIGGWPAPYGIVLVADTLSGLMVAVSGLIALAVSLYACFDFPQERIAKGFTPLFFFLLLGVNGAFITGDLFNLFVWFEVMLLSSFVLLVMGGEKEQLEGAIKYLTINLVSSAFFLIAAGLIYAKAGTLNMADLSLKLANSPNQLFINSSAILLLVSFSIKAALFPFFFWLPSSYHTPPIAISALFAGLLTKVGVYAMMRVFGGVFSQNFETVQLLLLGLSIATMVTGVLGAAAHFEIRRILSFHIISQIGYIVLGLALYTPLALSAAIFYTLHHIIVKANLFLLGGIVERILGTGQLKHTGGLYRDFPLLSALFFIPAFSLGGIPPLSGFWAKLGIVRAGLDAEAYIAVGAALAVGVLTLFSMTKIWAEAFWKDRPGETKGSSATVGVRLRVRGLYLPVALLVCFTLFISFLAQPLWSLSAQAAEQLLDIIPYQEAVLDRKDV